MGKAARVPGHLQALAESAAAAKKQRDSSVDAAAEEKARAFFRFTHSVQYVVSGLFMFYGGFSEGWHEHGIYLCIIITITQNYFYSCLKFMFIQSLGGL